VLCKEHILLLLRIRHLDLVVLSLRAVVAKYSEFGVVCDDTRRGTCLPQRQGCGHDASRLACVAPLGGLCFQLPAVGPKGGGMKEGKRFGILLLGKVLSFVSVMLLLVVNPAPRYGWLQIE
jgi:hypothetical protein